MRDIFLEEAREVMQTAREALAQLAKTPNDIGEMTSVRRAFHTLKGSSRMVGLKDFGEAAWSLRAAAQHVAGRQRPGRQRSAGLQRRGARLPRPLDRRHRQPATTAGFKHRVVGRAADAMRNERRRIPVSRWRYQRARRAGASCSRRQAPADRLAGSLPRRRLPPIAPWCRAGGADQSSCRRSRRAGRRAGADAGRTARCRSISTSSRRCRVSMLDRGRCLPTRSADADLRAAREPAPPAAGARADRADRARAARSRCRAADAA